MRPKKHPNPNPKSPAEWARRPLALLAKEESIASSSAYAAPADESSADELYRQLAHCASSAGALEDALARGAAVAAWEFGAATVEAGKGKRGSGKGKSVASFVVRGRVRDAVFLARVLVETAEALRLYCEYTAKETQA